MTNDLPSEGSTITYEQACSLPVGSKFTARWSGARAAVFTAPMTDNMVSDDHKYWGAMRSAKWGEKGDDNCWHSAILVLLPDAGNQKPQQVQRTHVRLTSADGREAYYFPINSTAFGRIGNRNWVTSNNTLWFVTETCEEIAAMIGGAK